MDEWQFVHKDCLPLDFIVYQTIDVECEPLLIQGSVVALPEVPRMEMCMPTKVDLSVM